MWNTVHQGIHLLFDSTKTSLYYHYTSIDALLSIFNNHIKSGKKGKVNECTIRASNLRFLNDEKEYKDGVEFAQNKIDNKDSLKTILDESQGYGISFCGNGDLLSQWKWYGKDSGVSIGFNLENIKYQYWECMVDELPKYDILTCPLPVKYQDENKEEYWNKITKTITDNYLVQKNDMLLPQLFIPYCKDKGFSEEKESRLVFYTCENGEKRGIKFPIKYYVSNGVIKPTLNVKFISENNIVNDFIVGPGHNQNLIYNALIHIFDEPPFSFEDRFEQTQGHQQIRHKCKNGIMIYKSNIPFRG